MVINSVTDFRRWAKVNLLMRDMTAAQLAHKMQTHQPRISEALHGKPQGKKFTVAIIEELGGNVEDFKAIL